MILMKLLLGLIHNSQRDGGLNTKSCFFLGIGFGINGVKIEKHNSLKIMCLFVSRFL